MDDFKLMYKILKALRDMMECEEPDLKRLSEEALGTTTNRRNALLRMLYDDGYITDLDITEYVGSTGPTVSIPPVPRITIKGLQFMEENSLMKKAANLAKGIRSILP